MSIYKIEGNNKNLVKVDTTSLGEEGVWERKLQRMLRDQPEVLEDGLLIISEEFGNWQDSNRRIDLLGLDAEGRLVVIELKRGYTGEHMDLQALRYAAMVANMTYEQAVDTYQVYLQKRANAEGGSVDEDAAQDAMRDHLGNPEEEADAIHTEIPRIILASENFGKELTTCVMWLNDSWLRSSGFQIKCVRLQPHKNSDEILVESSVVIPLPEASDYQTQLAQRERETRPDVSGKAQTIQGADAFRESIERASEKFRAGLKRLYDAAITMENAKIAELFTYISGKEDYYRINLMVPGGSQMFVSFNHLLKKDRGGEISTWPTECSLTSLCKFDVLIDPVTSKSGFRNRRLSKKEASGKGLDAILTAVRDVYREASGRQI